MRIIVCCLLLIPFTSCSEQPVKESDATTFSYCDPASPGTIYIATNRRGISLSDTCDPIALKKWTDSVMKPIKPFHIEVYRDYILAFDPVSKTTEKVEMKNLVKIEWMPEPPK
jgi:hypothetical protein